MVTPGRVKYPALKRSSIFDTGLTQSVPNLSIERIPEGTHWVIHEQPQTVIDFMREFLATG